MAGRLYITSTDSSSTIAPQVTLTSDVAVYTFNSVGVISTAGADQLAADRDAVLAGSIYSVPQTVGQQPYSGKSGRSIQPPLQRQQPLDSL